MSKLPPHFKVLDLAGEPLAQVAQKLTEMGATVVKPSPARDDPHLDELFQSADLILETPDWPGSLEFSPARAPRAVWLKATPFGIDGPRSNWRASALGILAACGLLPTGEKPECLVQRGAAKTAYALASAEAMTAVLSAAASGRPQVIHLAIVDAIKSHSAREDSQLVQRRTTSGAEDSATDRSILSEYSPVQAVPYGVFPCKGEKRGIAIACWSDHEWLHLATIFGLHDHRHANQAQRMNARAHIESLVACATRDRDAEALARQLQYAGIEAVPVADRSTNSPVHCTLAPEAI